MLLTITTEHHPATDLGYLLYKNPSKLQTFDLTFGRAHVFYPEVSDHRCTAALLLEVDPVALVRNRPAGANPCEHVARFLRQRRDPHVAPVSRKLAGGSGGDERRQPRAANQRDACGGESIANPRQRTNHGGSVARPERRLKSVPARNRFSVTPPLSTHRMRARGYARRGAALR